jgi:hypothetical protein
VGLLGMLLVTFVAITFAGGAAFLVWRLLDRGEVDVLRGQVELLEQRLAALEAERASAASSQ